MRKKNSEKDEEKNSIIIINKYLTPSAQYLIIAKRENQTLQTPIFSGN